MTDDVVTNVDTTDLDALVELVWEQAVKMRFQFEDNPLREHWNAHNNLEEAVALIRSAQYWLNRAAT